MVRRTGVREQHLSGFAYPTKPANSVDSNEEENHATKQEINTEAQASGQENNAGEDRKGAVGEEKHVTWHLRFYAVAVQHDPQ
jgi:hypothetical protein